jgi:hypothetical protein
MRHPDERDNYPDAGGRNKLSPMCPEYGATYVSERTPEFAKSSSAVTSMRSRSTSVTPYSWATRCTNCPTGIAGLQITTVFSMQLTIVARKDPFKQRTRGPAWGHSQDCRDEALGTRSWVYRCHASGPAARQFPAGAVAALNTLPPRGPLSQCPG